MRTSKPVRRWRGAVCVLLLTLPACSIEEPRLPTLETELAVPLGNLTYGIDEFLRDQPALSVGPDGVVALHYSGNIDSVAVGDRLDVDITGKSVAAALGVITLEDAAAASYAFPLGNLYPPSRAMDGLSLPVPPFTFAVPSGDADLPGSTQASVVHGGVDVRIDNGLPIAVGGSQPPEQIVLRLLDSADGSDVAALVLDDAIPPSTAVTRFIDLSGALLPDSLRVQLAGGSPGTGGSPVGIDPAATLAITVQPRALEVDAAQAPVGPQSFADTTQVALSDSIHVVRAVIQSGVLQLDLQSDVPLPVVAEVTLPEVFDPQGQPVTVQVPLAVAGSASPSVDLVGDRIDFGAQPGDQLTVRTLVQSPGSGGASVWVAAAQHVAATLAPFTLAFDQVEGILEPQHTQISAREFDLPIPDDLPTLSLAQAELRVDIATGASMPGTVTLHLDGTNDDGAHVPLDLTIDLGQGEVLGGARSYRFDGNNSALLDFMNSRPTRMTIDGDAWIGDGVTVGTIGRDDDLVAAYTIAAPLTAAIAAQQIRIDPKRLGLGADTRRQIQERVQSASASVEIHSTLPLAARVFVGLDADTAAVFTNPRILLGPVEVPAASTLVAGSHLAAVSTSTLSLTPSELALLAETDLFQGVRIEIAGTAGQLVTLHQTDRIEVRGMLRARVRLLED